MSDFDLKEKRFEQEIEEYLIAKGCFRFYVRDLQTEALNSVQYIGNRKHTGTVLSCNQNQNWR